MNTLTVGELIKLLSNFNSEMPVVKSTLQGEGYDAIVNNGQFVYNVVEVTNYKYQFVDSNPGSPPGFDAIAL